jgi:hypothetical protein
MQLKQELRKELVKPNYSISYVKIRVGWRSIVVSMVIWWQIIGHKKRFILDTTNIVQHGSWRIDKP